MRRVFVDHLTLRVADLASSPAFYEPALAPLGAGAVELDGGEVAFGPPGSEDFVLAAGGPVEPVHVAFVASGPDAVGAFWDAALAAGGRDNGAPGPRPRYHAGYYAAYVLDPDGHNVEAVFHGPRAPVRVRALTAGDEETVRARIVETWATEVVVAHGLSYAPASLPGFLAERDGDVVGTTTYALRDDGAAEIVTLEASTPLGGIGTALVEAVVEAAQAAGCSYVVVTTTNDNVDALRFYQRRGFRLARLLRGAVDETRLTLKPQIPELGEFGIPLRDELELELEL